MKLVKKIMSMTKQMANLKEHLDDDEMTEMVGNPVWNQPSGNTGVGIKPTPSFSSLVRYLSLARSL